MKEQKFKLKIGHSSNLEMGSLYRLTMTNPISPAARPPTIPERLAVYLGSGKNNEKEIHLFLEYRDGENNYLVIKDKLTIFLGVEQIFPRDFYTETEELNTEQISHLPEEEKSQLLDIMQKSGVKI